MKNTVFWNVAPCRSCVNRHFGGTSVNVRLRGTTSQKTAFFILFYVCIFGGGIVNSKLSFNNVPPSLSRSV
jgi:hypothetical protein